MQDDATVRVFSKEGRCNHEAKVSKVFVFRITGAVRGFDRILFDQIDVEPNHNGSHDEKVQGLNQDKYQEVWVVAATHAIVEPLTVMVEPVYALIADIAVPTSWQNNYAADWTDLSHIKLFQ